ncbi:acyltransferase family protein [Streptococcus merionis]|uniref:Fucose 4-O-acetylase and related acetyltransferases n=1 Tax=Streptococcus merionis TaxID=400065 RepID=A0A239SU56_9STRE|nr:acyltransferase family protein [Streptococcus merionis]SNU88274.1 Fucose 4-O-acetylase and related acetyltransferases [Streptococcus merionis]
MLKERMGWIDSLRGFGIILVVLGHVDFPYKQYIYWFHMPLFFILSGITISLSREREVFYTKKVRSLIFPFVVMGTILIVIFSYFQQINFLKEITKFLLFGGVRSSGYVGAFWFLPSLFVTQAIFYEGYNLKKMSYKGILALLVISCGLLGNSNLPMNLSLFPIFMIYLIFGKFILPKIIKEHFSYKTIYIFAFSGILLGKYSDFQLDLKYGLISNYFLAIFIPITLTSLFVVLFYRSRLNFSKKILSYIGVRSLKVMLTHNFFIYNLSKCYDLVWWQNFILSVILTILSIFIYEKAIENTGKNITE